MQIYSPPTTTVISVGEAGDKIDDDKIDDDKPPPLIKS
jgi:hypothetical protein